MAQTKIQTAVNAQVPEVKAQQSVMAMMNGLLDGEKMRKRFDELLGKRSAQFISSLVNMVNDNKDRTGWMYGKQQAMQGISPLRNL